MSAVKQDNEIHSATAWRRDLLESGWTEINSITYRDLTAICGAGHTGHGASYSEGRAMRCRRYESLYSFLART